MNLRAFGNCRALREPGARLPSWQVIQRDYPELIDASRNPDCWFISHRWDDDGSEVEEPHPDPTGWQLQALLELADHYNYDKPDLCIWYDYMSLPQKPRTAAETAIFGEGLSNIRNVVAACQNIFLISACGDSAAGDLAAHLKRGWIVFELYIARSSMSVPLQLRQRDAARVNAGRANFGWDATVPSIHAVAPWEDAAQLEQWFRHRDIVCTNGSDLAFLSQLLHDSLGATPYSGAMKPLAAHGRTVLTTTEITEFAFINGCGLSPRRPDLFLNEPTTDFDAGKHVWSADIRQRPPALRLGVWTELTPTEITDRMISLQTGRSPMYPGIVFEASLAGGQVRAAIE